MSDHRASSSELRAIWRQLGSLAEPDRREIGDWLTNPSISPRRKALRDDNIRAMAEALGDISLRKKSEVIADGWEQYLATRWADEEHLSILTDDALPKDRWLHAMSRFNLGKCLCSRQIRNILR